MHEGERNSFKLVTECTTYPAQETSSCRLGECSVQYLEYVEVGKAREARYDDE